MYIRNANNHYAANFMKIKNKSGLNARDLPWTEN